MHVKARDQLQWLASISLQFCLSIHILILGLSVWVYVHTCLPVFACRGQKRALGVLPYHFLPLLGGSISPWTWGFYFLGRLARSQHAPVAFCLLQSWVTGAPGMYSLSHRSWDQSFNLCASAANQLSHIFSSQFSCFKYLIKKNGQQSSSRCHILGIYVFCGFACKHCGGSFQKDSVHSFVWSWPLE